jgi:hypothetical protein
MSANRKPMSTNHQKNHEKFYIDGAWVSPAVPKTLDVIDPATERAYTKISLGSAADVDRAVAAAKAAFPAFSRTTREQRLALLRKVLELYNARYDEIADAVTEEMGAPSKFARIWRRPSRPSKSSSSPTSAAIRASFASRSAWWASSPHGTGLSIRSSARWRRPSPRAARWC